MPSPRLLRSADIWTASVMGGLPKAGIDLSRQTFLIVLGDCIIGLAAYLMAFSLRSILSFPFTGELIPSERLLQVKHCWWLLLILQPVLLFFLDTYHEIRLKPLREFALLIAGATGIQVVVLAAVSLFTEDLTFPRTIFPVFWVLDFTGVLGWRSLIKRSASKCCRRALIVGSGPLAEHLMSELRRAPEIGLQVVGIVSDHLEKGRFVGPYEVLGSREEIIGLIGRHQIEDVILIPEEASWKDRLIESISNLEGSQARISIVPSIYETLIGRTEHFNIHDIPLIKLVGNPSDPVGVFSRRLRDVGLALIFIILLFGMSDTFFKVSNHISVMKSA